MLRQGFDLLDNRRIQEIAIGVASITAFPLAPFLLLTHIGVDWIAVSRLSLGQLGIHPFPAGAVDQSSQKRLIVSWLTIGL